MFAGGSIRGISHPWEYCIIYGITSPSGSLEGAHAHARPSFLPRGPSIKGLPTFSCAGPRLTYVHDQILLHIPYMLVSDIARCRKGFQSGSVRTTVISLSQELIIKYMHAIFKIIIWVSMLFLCYCRNICCVFTLLAVPTTTVSTTHWLHCC